MASEIADEQSGGYVAETPGAGVHMSEASGASLFAELSYEVVELALLSAVVGYGRVGSPYLMKSRVKTCLLGSKWVPGRAWQPSRKRPTTLRLLKARFMERMPTSRCSGLLRAARFAAEQRPVGRIL